MTNRSSTRSTLLKTLLATCLILLLGPACRSAATPEGERPSNWELRSYDVAPGDRVALVNVLKELLRNKERVELSPDGRLVILASPDTQKQVQREILEPMASRPRTAAPARQPPSLAITYWMVLARPGKTGEGAPVPPGLQEIAPLLPEIRKTTGAGELVLLNGCAWPPPRERPRPPAGRSPSASRPRCRGTRWSATSRSRAPS